MALLDPNRGPMLLANTDKFGVTYNPILNEYVDQDRKGHKLSSRYVEYRKDLRETLVPNSRFKLESFARFVQ